MYRTVSFLEYVFNPTASVLMVTCVVLKWLLPWSIKECNCNVGGHFVIGWGHCDPALHFRRGIIKYYPTSHHETSPQEMWFAIHLFTVFSSFYSFDSLWRICEACKGNAIRELKLLVDFTTRNYLRSSIFSWYYYLPIPFGEVRLCLYFYKPNKKTVGNYHIMFDGPN